MMESERPRTFGHPLDSCTSCRVCVCVCVGPLRVYISWAHLTDAGVGRRASEGVSIAQSGTLAAIGTERPPLHCLMLAWPCAQGAFRRRCRTTGPTAPLTPRLTLWPCPRLLRRRLALRLQTSFAGASEVGLSSPRMARTVHMCSGCGHMMRCHGLRRDNHLARRSARDKEEGSCGGPVRRFAAAPCTVGGGSAGRAHPGHCGGRAARFV